MSDHHRSLDRALERAHPVENDAAQAYRKVAIGRAERVEELLAERDALMAELRDLLDNKPYETILSSGFRQTVVLAADLRAILDKPRPIPPGGGRA